MYKTEIVPVEKLLMNDKNPRYIRDEKFKKLVKSIKEFPEMLHARQIAVCSDYTVLGGNMRTRACVEAGLTEVPVVVMEGLTESQKWEFVIKDNSSFGEWDWDVLANDWGDLPLDDWGIDIPEACGEDEEPKNSIPKELVDLLFSLSPEQAEQVKQKVKEVQKRGEFSLVENYGNENNDGNALYAIVTGVLN